MAGNSDSKQFSFRCNLNNAEHLKVYRTLMDLNRDIHKSISGFVLKALIWYINGNYDKDLTNSEKNRNENLEGYVKRKEIGDIELRIKADLMKEVAQLFGNMVMANQAAGEGISTGHTAKSGREYTQDHTNEGKNDSVPGTDETLEEMSVLFSQGNFGE